MVMCYLSAGCNYSVWTLLHHAFIDEKGRERSGARAWMESKDEWSQKEREILCSRLLLTTARSEMCVCGELCVLIII